MQRNVVKENEVKEQVWVELSALGLTPGMSLFLQGVRITKTRGCGGLNLAAQWQLKKGGWSPGEGWLLVTCRETPAILILKTSNQGFRTRRVQNP